MNALEMFMSNTAQQKQVIDAINLLAQVATTAAKLKGFHADEEEMLDALGPNQPWAESCILQAELARQMSEIAEAVEAVRKPGPDHHLAGFSNFIVEEADAVIRICDTVGKRNLPLGEAIVAKLLYNVSRPNKHGKGS